MGKKVLANEKLEWLEINQWEDTEWAWHARDYKLSVSELGVRLDHQAGSGRRNESKSEFV